MAYKDPEKQKAYQARWYQEQRDKVRRSVRDRRRNTRKWVEQYKTDHPTCNMCGLDYPPHILDFDHLPEYKKFRDIGKMAKDGFAIEKIEKEIEKCQLLCANCHRHITWERSVKVT